MGICTGINWANLQECILSTHIRPAVLVIFVLTCSLFKNFNLLLHL